MEHKILAMEHRILAMEHLHWIQSLPQAVVIANKDLLGLLDHPVMRENREEMENMEKMVVTERMVAYSSRQFPHHLVSYALRDLPDILVVRAIKDRLDRRVIIYFLLHEF
jgi:hypothetical protein